MDDARRLGALLAVGIDVAHHVVADHLFPLLGHLVVDVLGVGFQLVDLLLGDGQAQLHLRLRQGDPKLPPGAELHVRGEQVFHFLVRIPGGQGGFVNISCHAADQTFPLGFPKKHKEGPRDGVFALPAGPSLPFLFHEAYRAASYASILVKTGAIVNRFPKDFPPFKIECPRGEGPKKNFSKFFLVNPGLLW